MLFIQYSGQCFEPKIATYVYMLRKYQVLRINKYNVSKVVTAQA